MALSRAPTLVVTGSVDPSDSEVRGWRLVQGIGFLDAGFGRGVLSL